MNIIRVVIEMSLIKICLYTTVKVQDLSFRTNEILEQLQILSEDVYKFG